MDPTTSLYCGCSSIGYSSHTVCILRFNVGVPRQAIRVILSVFCAPWDLGRSGTCFMNLLSWALNKFMSHLLVSRKNCGRLVSIRGPCLTKEALWIFWIRTGAVLLVGYYQLVVISYDTITNVLLGHLTAILQDCTKIHNCQIATKHDTVRSVYIRLGMFCSTSCILIYSVLN